MATYQISPEFAGAGGYAKLAEWGKNIPKQALGIIFAVHELYGADNPVAETALCEYIADAENFKRLWPGSTKGTMKSVTSTVSQYRAALKLLPFLDVTIERGRGERVRRPAALVNPLTGEDFVNPFLRKKTKKVKSATPALPAHVEGQLA